MPTLIPSAAGKIFSHPTWDIALILALLAIGFFYGLAAGKRRVNASLLLTYVAYAVASAVPAGRIGAWLNVKESHWIAIAIFGIMFLLLFFLLAPRKGLRFARPGAWWQIFFLSVIQTGLFIHIAFGFLPPEKIKDLAPLTRIIFANPHLHLWWFLGPLVILAVMRRFDSRNE